MIKCLSLSNRDIIPSHDKHIIIADKKLGDLCWYLASEKDKDIDYRNTFWVKASLIDIDKYHYIDDDKEKQINDLININRELLIKLENNKFNKDDLIPLNKFQLVLDNLTEEQDKLRVANNTIISLKKDNQDLKNIIEMSNLY